MATYTSMPVVTREDAPSSYKYADVLGTCLTGKAYPALVLNLKWFFEMGGEHQRNVIQNMVASCPSDERQAIKVGIDEFCELVRDDYHRWLTATEGRELQRVNVITQSHLDNLLWRLESWLDI